jgi:hypothetical protein
MGHWGLQPLKFLALMPYLAARTFRLAFLAPICAALVACNQSQSAASAMPGPAPEAAIEQSTICHTTDWEPAIVGKSCKTAQKVVFLPNSFGNQQLPILFAAGNCDLRYSVVSTVGGVTCIFKGVKIEQTEQKAPAPAN